MKFLLLASCVCVALARPGNLGYNFNAPPATSYGVPLGSRLSGNVISQIIPSSQSIPFPPATSYEVPNQGLFSFNAPLVSTTERTYDLGYTASPFGAQLQSFPGGSAGLQTVQVGYPGFAGGSQFDASFGNNGFSGIPSGVTVTQSGTSGQFNSQSQSQSQSPATTLRLKSQPAQVNKHLYFFTAPEQPQEIRARVNVNQPAPQKNYKIIFIKTPEYLSSGPINVPLPQQNEEKTLVYVLVRNPEQGPEVNVVAGPQQPPAKPEVFFIRYNTQAEAQAAINSAQGGSVAGVTANPSEGNEFVQSIDSASFRSGGGSVSGVTVSPLEGNGYVQSQGGSSFRTGGGSVSGVTVSPLEGNGYVQSQGGVSLNARGGIQSGVTENPLVSTVYVQQPQVGASLAGSLSGVNANSLEGTRFIQQPLGGVSFSTSGGIQSGVPANSLEGSGYVQQSVGGVSLGARGGIASGSAANSLEGAGYVQSVEGTGSVSGGAANSVESTSFIQSQGSPAVNDNTETVLSGTSDANANVNTEVLSTVTESPAPLSIFNVGTATTPGILVSESVTSVPETGVVNSGSEGSDVGISQNFIVNSEARLSGNVSPLVSTVSTVPTFNVRYVSGVENSGYSQPDVFLPTGSSTTASPFAVYGPPAYV